MRNVRPPPFPQRTISNSYHISCYENHYHNHFNLIAMQSFQIWRLCDKFATPLTDVLADVPQVVASMTAASMPLARVAQQAPTVLEVAVPTTGSVFLAVPQLALPQLPRHPHLHLYPPPIQRQLPYPHQRPRPPPHQRLLQTLFQHQPLLQIRHLSRLSR